MVMMSLYKDSSRILHGSSEASVVLWLSYSPCKPGVVRSDPGFSSLSEETICQGPVSV